VRAVQGVDLDVYPGEIHALCGENGAGKTTLASIAAGKLKPSGGSVVAHGVVGLVHQHFELVDRLRVWENVVLGHEPHRGAKLDREAARERVNRLSKEYGLAVDPDAVIETLPVGIAQRVELLRELARDPAVLILDEPTAVLAPVEIDALFATVRALAARGTAVLIITHKLQEVVSHTSRITVMRAGKVVARLATADTDVDAIARAMVGGELPELAARQETIPARAFSMHDVSAGESSLAVRAASLEVRGGEIVGIAGVEGNGQSALADAIAGVLPYSGRMELDGTPIPPGDPGARIAQGIRAIPQDRRREALVLPWSVIDNVALGDQRRKSLRKGATVDRQAARELARSIVERFDVRTPSLNVSVAALSGGNQQKVVVGRALAHDPRLLLAYQPTRGIDVGAAALVQSRLIEARNAGVAVLLISFELDEVLALSDRVIVMYRGAIVGSFERNALDRARIGALMAGAGLATVAS
jgi:simple sugar transport system ATP-binding protein